MLKIAIIGSTGFVGRHLLSKLDSSQYEITEIFHFIIDWADIKNIVREQFDNANAILRKKFDYVFHLAAWTQAGDFCLHHPAEQFFINQRMNTNILDWWRMFQPQAKIILMGSSCAYDSNIEKKEENYLRGEVDKDLFSYAMTKRMLLIGAQACAKQYNLKYIYFIPSTFYGPNFNLGDSHFIFDLIKKICNAKWLKQEPVVLWGDGYQKRELVYIEDGIDTMMVNLSSENEVINISTGIEHSIREYAEIICDYVQYPFRKIEFDTSKFVGVKSKVLVPSKSVNTLRKTDIYTGIKKTIDFYLNKINN